MYLKTAIIILFTLGIGSIATLAQTPTVLTTNTSGSWTDYSLTDRGGTRGVTVQAGSAGTKAFLFPNASGNYNPKWCGSNSDYSRSKDSRLAGKAFVYSSGGWDRDMEFSASSSNYYTFIIGKTANSNNDMSVLETSYNPRTISSVSGPSSTVYPGQSATVSVTLSGAPQSGERVYIRYHSGGGFSSATITEITNFGGTSSGSVSISSVTAGATYTYYIFTSNQAVSSNTDADYLSLRVANNSGSHYSFTVASAWITTSGATNWNSGSSWAGGNVPVSNQPVTIAHALTLNSDVSVSSLTINSGVTFTGSDNTGRTLTIAGGGTFSNTSGTFVPAGGKVYFSSGGSANGNMLFYNVDVGSGGLSLSGDTISGTLKILASGFINASSAPIYKAGSTLAYNTGGSYDRSTEWSATSGAGYPHHVSISGTTVLNLSGSAAGTARSCAGDLTIASGASLTMNKTGDVMTAALTVAGNVTVNGTLTLSSSSGGDILVGGNWTRGSSGTFTPNSRSVTFNGASNQTIEVTGGGNETFAYLLINKSSGSLMPSNTSGNSTNLIISATSGNVLEISNSGGINLNNRTMRLQGNSSSSGAAGNINVVGGNRSIGGSGTFSIEGNLGNQPTYYSKKVTSSSGGTLTFGPNVLVTIGDGRVDFGNGLTTIQGTLQVNLGGSCITNSPTYDVGSTLQFANTVDYQINSSDLTWAAGSSGAGVPYHVCVLDSGTDLILNASRTFRGNMTITNGSLTLNLQELRVGGNWTRSGATSQFIANTSLVTFTTSGTTIANTGSVETFYDLAVNPGSGVVSMNSNVSVTDELTLTSGSLSLNGYRLVLNDSLLGSGLLRGSSTSRLALLTATGTAGTANFESGYASLDTLEINRSSGGLTLGGNLTIQGELKLTNGTLYIGNNTLSLNGSTSGSGSLNSSGSAVVNVGGSGNSFGTLRFASGANTLSQLNVDRDGSGQMATVQLGSDVAVSGQLNLTSGNLKTGSYKVTLGSTGTFSEVVTSNPPAQTDGYLEGTVETSRSLSANTTETFGGIGVSLTMGVSNSITATRVTGTAISSGNGSPYTGNQSIKRYFAFTASTNSGLNAAMVFRYYDHELNGITESELVLYRHADPYTNSNWTDFGGKQSVNTSANWVANDALENKIQALSTWTLGSRINSPLPLTWLSFNGEVDEFNAILYWSTAQEIQVDHFEVMRSSDMVHWQCIHTEAAQGGSLPTKYAYTDVGGNGCFSANYYRVIAVEVDGNTSSTPVWSTRGEALSNEVYYRVKEGGFVQPSGITGTWQVFDVSGRLIKSGEAHGESMVLCEAPAGIYIWVNGEKRQRIFIP